MSVKKIFPLDPYNEDHLKIIKEIINNSKFEAYYCNTLLENRNSFTKEEYLENKKLSNELEDILIVEEDSKIKGYCHIKGEKDLKMCQLSFPVKDNKLRNIVALFTEYAQNQLNFEEVFIKLDNSDKSHDKMLRDLGFESLGEELGKSLYLKEKEHEQDIQRKI